MSLIRHLPSALAAACAAAVLSACVVAPPPPAHHPAYLHALTDLRDARWNLGHRPGDAAVSQQEDVAIVEIDRAIADARAAAAEDGKNLADHPHEDARLDRRGRLHRAVELLHKAHQDIAQAEDNPDTRELRNRVVGHIDAATRAAEHALHDAEQGL
ncbi:MAG TPA: hypothetical protein VF453_14500 [Burkholderiaceae bacterium]